MRLLAGLGVVGIGPSRGYVLMREGAELAAMSVTARPPVEEQLRAALIRDRLAGDIAAEQSQAELARRYAVGLPTLQRVLRRMEQEGLMSHEGWQWSFAATLETRQSREASYQLRLILEPAALLLPGFAADPTLLDQLITEHGALLADPGLADLDPMRIFDLDARFHEALAGFSGNPFLRNVVRQQNALRGCWRRAATATKRAWRPGAASIWRFCTRSNAARVRARAGCFGRICARRLWRHVLSGGCSKARASPSTPSKAEPLKS
ncbi:MAG: GntR family transcriptional regulator [Acetobacteraceae bacterium]